MDHQTGPQAQGDARTNMCRSQEPWPWKGSQVPPHYWWFSPCSLEKAQYSLAPLLPLICVMFIKFLLNTKFRTVKEKKKKGKERS